jgi:hypothetical protein
VLFTFCYLLFILSIVFCCSQVLEHRVAYLSAVRWNFNVVVKFRINFVLFWSHAESNTKFKDKSNGNFLYILHQRQYMKTMCRHTQLFQTSLQTREDYRLFLQVFFRWIVNTHFLVDLSLTTMREVACSVSMMKNPFIIYSFTVMSMLLFGN